MTLSRKQISFDAVITFIFAKPNRWHKVYFTISVDLKTVFFYLNEISCGTPQLEHRWLTSICITTWSVISCHCDKWNILEQIIDHVNKWRWVYRYMLFRQNLVSEKTFKDHLPGQQNVHLFFVSLYSLFF